ncbi:MAG: FAD-dependent oxidoreductase [Streptosporangiaceae bacterium]
MRVRVAGGGLAGSLLAWRLAQLPGTRVELLTGPLRAADATAASGGAVRAYDALPEQRELAIESLAELLASPVLREWAQYRETGFAYLRGSEAAGEADLAKALADIERELPGSAELTSPASVFGAQAGGPGWAGDDTMVVVRERRAGCTSPHRLREAVLADLAARPQAEVLGDPIEALGAGASRGFDAVVLAVGAWTPGLLHASGLPTRGYRTRSIQYTVYDSGPVQPPAFADERTGLYGLPTAGGGQLLGVPTTEWDAPPGITHVTEARDGPAGHELARHELALRLADGCFPGLKLGSVRRRVAAADCYCDPPVLALREIGDRVYTFTGGSGGCAKSVLAASRRAAHSLVQDVA